MEQGGKMGMKDSAVVQVKLGVDVFYAQRDVWLLS